AISTVEAFPTATVVLGGSNPIPVDSTAGFRPSGTLTVLTQTGATTVNYTSTDATHFLGCSGGTGTVDNLGTVTQSVVVGVGVSSGKFSVALYDGATGTALGSTTTSFGSSSSARAAAIYNDGSHYQIYVAGNVGTSQFGVAKYTYTFGSGFNTTATWTTTVS